MVSPKTMSLAVRLVQSEADLESSCSVLVQIREHMDAKALLAQIRLQRERGYQMALAEAEGEVVGVAGFVIGYKLSWGKHMYIDDLVTSEQVRSMGIGSHLIAWLKRYARDQGCGQIHLDSYVQRFAAHRFYLRHGFNIASHHFSLKEL